MKENKILKIFLFVLFGIVLVRLFFICIIKHSYYLKEYDALKEKIVYSYAPPRGRILDRKGNILVDNKGIKVLVYSKLPNIKKETELEVAEKLASILTLELGDIKKEILQEFYYVSNKDKIDSRVEESVLSDYKNRLITQDQIHHYRLSLIKEEELNNVNKSAAFLYNEMNKGYLYQEKILKRDITDEEFTKINELHLEGVHIEIEWERTFNYETCLNTLFGAIGKIPAESREAYLEKGYQLNDIVGVSFLEKYYEEQLKGEKGSYKVNNDNTLTEIIKEQKGNDLVLAIDIEKQLQIEESLKKQIIEAKKFPSSKYYKGSYIVISDPKTGEIISLVALQYDGKTFKSDVIGLLTNSYTVGSIVKGASQSVAYVYGAINEKTKLVDSCVKLYSQKEKCSWKRLGTLNDISALTYSSNYFQFISAIKVAGYKYKRGMVFNPTINDFTKYRNIFKEYGLGVKTEIDIGEEELGITGSQITGDLLLNFSIGQYDTYTPLMLNQYVATLANGKNRLKLHLGTKIVDHEGNSIILNKNNILNSLTLEEKYMKRIQEGLRSVVVKGTAASYMKPLYKGAGKTGTSETFYNGKKTTTKSFIMYAPYDDPEYAMVIISPHIAYENKGSNYKYPINSRLSREITTILFEN